MILLRRDEVDIDLWGDCGRQPDLKYLTLYFDALSCFEKFWGRYLMMMKVLEEPDSMPLEDLRIILYIAGKESLVRTALFQFGD